MLTEEKRDRDVALRGIIGGTHCYRREGNERARHLLDALLQAGWDEMLQMREEVGFTKSASSFAAGW